ncbi:MAG: class I SAM-dependent methyltransferase [Atopobiaceae bacterium]
MTLRGDLEHMECRLRPGNLSHELVVRAARLKGVERPTAVDATAGLGEDSLLLAAAGFTVTLYERDPVIAALLRDSLRRAAAVPQLAQAVGRMRLVEGDSIEALEGMAGSDTRPDLVLLDPMFPARHKSASVKKKLQLLQTLERPCDDEERLLQAARDAGPRKIIVKRPAKGPTLAGMKPSYSVSGKAIRFDCLVLPR